MMPGKAKRWTSRPKKVVANAANSANSPNAAVLLSTDPNSQTGTTKNKTSVVGTKRSSH